MKRLRLVNGVYEDPENESPQAGMGTYSMWRMLFLQELRGVMEDFSSVRAAGGRPGITNTPPIARSWRALAPQSRRRLVLFLFGYLDAPSMTKLEGVIFSAAVIINTRLRLIRAMKGTERLYLIQGSSAVTMSFITLFPPNCQNIPWLYALHVLPLFSPSQVFSSNATSRQHALIFLKQARDTRSFHKYFQGGLHQEDFWGDVLTAWKWSFEIATDAEMSRCELGYPPVAFPT